jgi:hypothetical protein
VARTPTSGTCDRPVRRALRWSDAGRSGGNQYATACAPALLAASISGSRSAGEGLVLSTTTSRPAASAAAISCSWRRCRFRAFGKWSLLTTTYPAPSTSRQNVDFPDACNPISTATTGTQAP